MIVVVTCLVIFGNWKIPLGTVFEVSPPWPSCGLESRESRALGEVNDVGLKRIVGERSCGGTRVAC